MHVPAARRELNETMSHESSWDEISTDVQNVDEFEGGELYRHETLDLVVLNGSYKEMGRQYGTLLKEKIEWVKDTLVNQYIESEALSYDTIMDVVGEPFYKAAPKRFKDLYAGISEITGLDVYEVSAMDQQLSMVLLDRRTVAMAGCTSLFAWGSNTKDGEVYSGRNLDFPRFWRDLMEEAGVFVVMNPIGGDFGYAGVGIAGMLSGFDDSMNSEGLYAEFNNGAGSIGPTMYSNRINVVTWTADLQFEYSEQEEIVLNLNATQANYPCILGTATPERGQYYEISPDSYRAPGAEETDLTARANQFIDSSWGIPDLPTPGGWYSRTRRESFTSLVQDHAPNVDETVIMDALNTPLFDDDGNVNDVGLSVFDAPGTETPLSEVTATQVVTKPAERMMWVRIPTVSGWMEFDLTQYFTAD